MWSNLDCGTCHHYFCWADDEGHGCPDEVVSPSTIRELAESQSPGNVTASRTCPCDGCKASDVFKETWDWPGAKLESELGKLAKGKITLGRKEYECIPCTVFPAAVRVFLKKALEGASNKTPQLPCTLHPAVALMHTAHWDVDGWLPWVDLKKRSALASAVAELFLADGQINNNIKKELQSATRKLPPHIKPRQKTFPAAMEYALPALGGSARMVLMYEADGADGLVVFISSHYGSAQEQSQKHAERNPFWVITGIADDPICSPCCPRAEAGVALATPCVFLADIAKLKTGITTQVNQLFAFNRVGKPGNLDKLYECDNGDFFGKLFELCGWTYQDIFGKQVAWQGAMGYIEPTKHETDPGDMPEFHISVRTTSGEEAYYDFHLTFRPSFRYYVSQHGSFPTTQMGVSTSYIFYRLFYDPDENKFRIYNKGGDDFPIGESKLSLAICWAWLQKHNQKKIVSLFKGLALLEQRLEKLNALAAKFRDLKGWVEKQKKQKAKQESKGKK